MARKVVSKTLVPAKAGAVSRAGTKTGALVVQQSRAQAEPAAADPASASQLFFYRNKARLLEQDLAALEARSRQQLADIQQAAEARIAEERAAHHAALIAATTFYEPAPAMLTADPEPSEPPEPPEPPEPQAEQFQLSQLEFSSLEERVEAQHQELHRLASTLIERDSRIAEIDAELGRRDALMRSMEFRVAWKLHRLPAPIRALVKVLLLPVTGPYLIYRAVRYGQGATRAGG